MERTTEAGNCENASARPRIVKGREIILQRRALQMTYIECINTAMMFKDTVIFPACLNESLYRLGFCFLHAIAINAVQP